jgi:hypothetical protein
MKLNKIWFADQRIYGETDDGRVLWQSLLYYKRLMNATPEQLKDYEMDDEGIHWEALDEDVSFESFEYENPEPQGMSRFFLMHPELNAGAIAQRAGISRDVMTQYVNGTRVPLPCHETRIRQELKAMAKEYNEELW